MAKGFELPEKEKSAVEGRRDREGGEERVRRQAAVCVCVRVRLNLRVSLPLTRAKTHIYIFLLFFMRIVVDTYALVVSH